MLVPEISILLQTLIDDALQFDWQVRIQTYCRGWCPIQNRLEDYPGTFSTERQRPSRHFVEDSAEREQIRSCVQFLSTDLFWRHVRDSSHRRSRTGQMFATRFDCRLRHSRRRSHLGAV